jgi:hypothetical protein
MKLSKLLACILVLLMTVSIGHAELRLTTGGLSKWAANVNESGCGLNYYIRDHRHDVKADHLNMYFSFRFIVSNKAESRRLAGPLPKREKIIIIRASGITSLKIVAEGKAFSAAESGNSDGESIFYFDPEAAKDISGLLNNGTPIGVQYSYADGLEHTRSIGLASFGEAHSMFKACASIAATPMNAPGQSQWQSSFAEIGCGMHHYQYDHPRDYSIERRLRIDAEFMFFISSDLDFYSDIGPFPIRETILVVSANNPLINPRISEFGFVVNGISIKADRKGKSIDGQNQHFYFKPEAAKKLGTALTNGGSIAISYRFEDGITNDQNRIMSERLIDGFSYDVAEAMYKACLSFI